MTDDSTSSSIAASVASPSQGLTALASSAKSRTTSHTAETHKPHAPTLHHPLPHPLPHPTSDPWTPSSPPSTTSAPKHLPLTRHHKPIVIVFIVLGGLILLGILSSIARCGWSWYKTPSRDRIAGLLNRYHLEREMEEAAVVEPLRARAMVPPPPPYFPPPPEYGSMMPSSPPPAHIDEPTSAQES